METIVIIISYHCHYILTFWIHDETNSTITQGLVMNKPVFNNEHITYNDLILYTLILTSLCLVTTWFIEVMANLYFRMG